MSSPTQTPPTLESVEAVVRENVSGYVDREQHEHEKQRLLATLREGRGSRLAPWYRRAALVTSLGLLLAAGAFAWKKHRSLPLGYDVRGGLLSDSGYLRSTDPSGARLSFTDGTQVELQDGSRARIAAVDSHGARLAIENGHATLSVARRPGAAWYVDAGPFVIQVTGTRFDVDWSSYDDTLSVDLHEGNLVVSGPPAPNGVLVRAGQRLTALEGRLSIEALDAAPRGDNGTRLQPLSPELDSLLSEPGSLENGPALVPSSAPTTGTAPVPSAR